MRFFDVHTHFFDREQDVISVLNCPGNFKELKGADFFTAGIHPWFVKPDTFATELEDLNTCVDLENVIAIGECGLDKVCDVDMDLQRIVFGKQIELAISSQKPLLIHCVRAYDEVFTMLREYRIDLPVIFHGFNKSAELATRIISQRDQYFISFGKHLTDDRVAEVFRGVPVDRFFLETDSSKLSIKDIYRAAAAARGITITEIADKINVNAKHVFGVTI